MKRAGLILALSGLILVVSCGDPRFPDPFVFQMDWTHEAEFTGFYAAQEQGAFRDAGLGVTLVEGPAGTDVPGVLAAGRADAAQMGMTMYLAAVGRDPDLIAVMAVFQSSPRVLITRAERGIRSPRDLEGMRVGIKSAYWETLVRRMMINGGAEPSRIVEIPVAADDIDRFYRGDIDVWTGFSTSETVQAQLAGHPVNQMFADDFGAGGYDELIVVKQSSLAKNQDLYHRFIHALIRGWTWAMDHGQEAVRLVDRWQPRENHDFHTLAWKAVRPLVSTGRVPIGWIENSRWPTGVPLTTNLLDRP
jgi:ABC-type nitrate/sulfonate/bicarbonate transport system substrate-binding protein